MKKMTWLLIGAVVLSLGGCGRTDRSASSLEQGAQEMETVTEEPEVQATTESVEDSNKITYVNHDFSLQLPKSWKEHYVVMETEDCGIMWRGFYEKGCYEELDAGWLFSIAGYQDNSYEEQPSYEVIGEWKGKTYVLILPTDVQFIGASKAAQKRYCKMAAQVEKIAKTFEGK